MLGPKQGEPNDDERESPEKIDEPQTQTPEAPASGVPALQAAQGRTSEETSALEAGSDGTRRDALTRWFVTDEDKIEFIELVGAACTKSCRPPRDELDERMIAAVEAKVAELKAGILAQRD